MIKEIQELNFPKKDGKQYASLTHAIVSLQDMAEKTISTQVSIDGEITPDFSYDWVVVFQSEKYIMPLRQPQGAKENTSLNSTIDLTFQHWAIYQLKRWYFFTLADVKAGTAVPDQYNASVNLNLKDFCDLFAQILGYYYGDKIRLDLNPNWEGASEPTLVKINHSYIWDVLIKLYDLYAVRWVIEADSDIDHYVIKVGYPTTEISQIFEYGFKGGLLKVERQVQDENIRNMIIGRGGNRNLPYRYFKKHDKDNATFSPDPDWIPELANIPFSELHGATFRSYIQGWKAAHIGQYRADYPDEEWVLTTPSSDKAYAPWAWTRGYTDTKFNPVEFVADEFCTDNNGYGVVANSSIAKYGELMGGLDNNEDIYPTIQGVEIAGLGRIDEAVAVEEILSDDWEQSGGNATTKTAPGCSGISKFVAAAQYVPFTIQSSGTFAVGSGRHADLMVDVEVMRVGGSSDPLYIAESAEIKPGSQTTRVFNVSTGEEHSASGIPEGTWRYEVSGEVHNKTLDKTLDITFGDAAPRLFDAMLGDKPSNTWNIWVKNIWESTRLPDETDAQYAERVWRPILGDREGNEAKVVFSDGMLAASSAYEFAIVKGGISYDTSKDIEIKDMNGNIMGRCPSHWRITLSKSDADLESTGVYIPSTKRFASAGDHLFFIGIDMPHMYVVKAEERLDDWKKDELAKVKDINPTFVVGLDKVRIHNYGKANALVEQLRIGNSLRLADKRFVLNDTDKEEAAYVSLYIQSITYNYIEPTDKKANLLPDIEVVLSDKYEMVANPVSTLQGEVDAIRAQIGGSISNISQIVVKTGDARYLRKDREDVATGHIDFLDGLDSYKKTVLREGAQFGRAFAPGMTGFGGMIDGNADGELNSLRLRSWLEVPELRYNRTEISIGNDWNAPGGGIIENVEPDYDENGIMQRTGTITLHLEGGEIGAVAEDDICQGIFHDGFDLSNNATQDEDDGRGNFRFAGFHTVYFRIMEIIESGRNSVFRYMIRPVSARWSDSFHPSEQMHFVGYGNFTKKERQTSRYATRTYERYLKDVNDWEFSDNNIAAQFGDLSNLSVFGLNMTGYSVYLNNIYMTGRIHQLDVNPLYMAIDYENDNLIAYGETKTITCRVFRGFEDVTSEVAKWAVTRDSGIAQDDAAWLLKPKVQNFAGTLDICFNANENDIGNNSNSISTLFTFTAELPGASSPVTHQLIF